MPIIINPPVASSLQRSAAAERVRSITGSPGIPLYIYVVSVSSLLTIIGILWDIAWHRSIGRDKFLTPPHILIYLGAIFAGLFSGIQVIWNSLHLTPELKASSVRVWGIFYSSLGALFCIWGAIAMLTSAPFDDWWHSAYGLDVKILSPPHVLLGLGIKFLTFGACVSLCKYINLGQAGILPADKGSGRGRLALLQFLFVIAASSLLTQVLTLSSSFLETRHMRGTFFYQASAFACLLFLPALARGLRMKWGMTAITFGYFLIAGLSNWIVQIFPAEPKLGPILTHTTHFQPANFPILLFIPAVFMDIVMQRSKGKDWSKALLLSIVFVFVLLAVQYPFSGFLLESPSSRNWFFGGGSWYYLLAPDWPYRYKFRPEDIAGLQVMIRGLGIAVAVGFIASWISLRWGLWMQRIQR
jgi:hypothetical protein